MAARGAPHRDPADEEHALVGVRHAQVVAQLGHKGRDVEARGGGGDDVLRVGVRVFVCLRECVCVCVCVCV